MTSRSLSYALSAGLFLVGQPVPTAAPTIAGAAPVDLVFIADVSGSMDHELPGFKRDLGNMIPRVLKGGDTFSLIYFSGPGQCALLIDQMPVRTGSELVDITAIQTAIRGLHTIGMTCFVDPLKLLADVAGTMKSARPKSLRAAVFGSDGYHNTGGSMRDVMAAVEKAVGAVDRWTVLGVGYGCDQHTLQTMAAKGSGTFLFSADAARYARDFEVSAGKRPTGAPRKVVKLDTEALGRFAFSIAADGTITQHEAEDGSVAVPADAGTLWYVTEHATAAKGADIRTIAITAATVADKQPVDAAYAELALFSQRCKRATVRGIAYGIGDTRLAKLAANAFGPQRYNGLADEALEAVDDAARRFTEGAGAVAPDPNQYTVLEALKALYGGDNRIVPDAYGWKYSPITRARIPSAGVLTEEDVKALRDAMALEAGAPVESIAALEAAIATLKASKAPATTWRYAPAPEGYPIDGLVIGSKEANVSVRIKRPIVISLEKALAQLPEDLRGRLPTEIVSTRYQSFTIITGPLLNCSMLPVSLDASTWETFRRAGLVSGPHDRHPVLVDFLKLPIINDAMIEGLTAAEAVRTTYELLTVGAALKPVNDLKDALPKREQRVVNDYLFAANLRDGEADAVKAWLSALGIGDSFQPPSTTAEKSGDVRRSWILKVGIPGLGTLPSCDDVRDKVAKIAAWQAGPKKGREPKLTRSEALLAPHVAEVDLFVKDAGIDLAKPTAKDIAAIESFVERKSAPLEKRRHKLLLDLGQMAIIAICGGEWFGDLIPGETEIELTMGGEAVKCSVDIKDVDIAL